MINSASNLGCCYILSNDSYPLVLKIIPVSVLPLKTSLHKFINVELVQ
uniref:Uncharacterized protein n=1 Tax=Setaria italica TaxID=4555 RepID=K3XTS9_SETIT